MPRLAKAAGKSLESQRINEKLESIKTNIGKQYQCLCDRDSYVTAEKVRNAFLGMGDDCRLLLQTFDEYQVVFVSCRKMIGNSPDRMEQEPFRPLLSDFIAMTTSWYGCRRR